MKSQFSLSMVVVHPKFQMTTGYYNEMFLLIPFFVPPLGGLAVSRRCLTHTTKTERCASQLSACVFACVSTWILLLISFRFHFDI